MSEGGTIMRGRVALLMEPGDLHRRWDRWVRDAGHRVVEHRGLGALVASDPAPEVVIASIGDYDPAKLAELLPDATRIGVGSGPDEALTGWYELLQTGAEEAAVRASVRRAVERSRLFAAANPPTPDPFSLVVESPAMREVERQVTKVAGSDVTVALRGERGVGKDLVARLIHRLSRRASGPFVTINCAALPESVHEGELFGVAGGGLPGVGAERPGRLEQASGGTLYLDDVGALSALTQASLLRALQEQSVRRVGSPDELPIDVRVVCSSSEDLEAQVRAGRFREDLFFRLVVYPLVVPPLRERREDIPELVRRALVRYAADAGRRPPRVAPAALDALCRYEWPANVRQLENALQRAAISAEGDTLELQDFPGYLGESVGGQARTTEVLPLAELEKRAIRHALEVTEGSVDRAAKLLGMGRATLYRRLAKYDADSE